MARGSYLSTRKGVTAHPPSGSRSKGTPGTQKGLNGKGLGGSGKGGVGTQKGLVGKPPSGRTISVMSGR